MSTLLNRSELGRLVFIALQLALLLLVVQLYRPEEATGFPRLSWALFVGFLVHSVLPLRFRPWFFLLFAWSCFGFLLGKAALVLVGFGLGLIGLCHLPVGFRMRVALVSLAGGLLAMTHGGWSSWEFPESWRPVLPILGSMFMFRLIIYLYDLRHEKGKMSLAVRLSYFFLLPNVCFLLFPIVDYQTYKRTYYDKEAAEIYQKGLLWMFRGLTHLLLYRLIYLHLVPNPAELDGLFDVVQYALTLWVLYLRVSGLFHLSVGILCLFGMNLPATNHLYFLASGPNDLWRRANIYWKDFMMKVFYYPTFMPLRQKLGMSRALVGATVAVFLATWALHSYQWFWLLGTFPLRLNDLIFWLILGGLLLGNSLWELKLGRKRSLSRTTGGWSFRRSLAHAMKVLGMFSFICILWSWWSAESTTEWWGLLAVARESEWREFGLMGLMIAGVLGAGVSAQFGSHRGVRLSLEGSGVSRWRVPIVVSVGSILLLLIGTTEINRNFEKRYRKVVRSLQGDRLNRRDADVQQRGYYESVLESTYSLATGGHREIERRPEESDKLKRYTGDALDFELRTMLDTTFRGVAFQTNRWGMRDRYYPKQSPPNALRIALLGSSPEMGGGIRESDIYPSIVERRLNERPVEDNFEEIELLNFAVHTYGLHQNVLVLEQKVIGFDPDLVLYTGHSGEISWSLHQLHKVIRSGVELPGELQSILDRAQVDKTKGIRDFRRRVGQAGASEEILRWAYQRLVDRCLAEGIKPIWVYIPGLNKVADQEEPETLLEGVAMDTGFEVLSLRDAFDGVDPTEISYGPGDFHPNELAHRLLADRLYDVLLENRHLLRPREILRETPQ